MTKSGGDPSSCFIVLPVNVTASATIDSCQIFGKWVSMLFSTVERKTAFESVETIAETLPVLHAAISKPPAPEKSETMRTLSEHSFEAAAGAAPHTGKLSGFLWLDSFGTV